VQRASDVNGAHVNPAADVDGRADDDEARRPAVEDVKRLVRKASELQEVEQQSIKTTSDRVVLRCVQKRTHLGQDVVLARETDDERNVGIGEPGSVMGHPVDVALGAEEDEEKVEKEVDKDDEELADVAERDGLGDGRVLDGVLAPEGRQPVPEEPSGGRTQSERQIEQIVHSEAQETRAHRRET